MSDTVLVITSLHKENACELFYDNNNILHPVHLRSQIDVVIYLL